MKDEGRQEREFCNLSAACSFEHIYRLLIILHPSSFFYRVVLINISVPTGSLTFLLPVIMVEPAPAPPPTAAPIAAPLPPPAMPPIIAPSAAPPPVRLAVSLPWLPLLILPSSSTSFADLVS